jgi:hypothetical protein
MIMAPYTTLIYDPPWLCVILDVEAHVYAEFTHYSLAWKRYIPLVIAGTIAWVKADVSI